VVPRIDARALYFGGDLAYSPSGNSPVLARYDAYDPTSYSYCPECGEELETTMHEGEKRLASPDADCGFIHFDNPTPVVAAIVEREGRVVLVQNEGTGTRWRAAFWRRKRSPKRGCSARFGRKFGCGPKSSFWSGSTPSR